MKNQFESTTPELIDDNEMPPREILRPGEQIELMTETEVATALDELKKENKISKKVEVFLRRWAMRGLMALSIAYGAGMIQEKDMEERNNMELLVDDKSLDPGVDVPEIVIYGHKDKTTNDILNFLSGKDEMSLELRREIEARGFQAAINQAREIFLDPGEEKKERGELTVGDEFPVLEPFIESMEDKFSGFDERTYESYKYNEEYKKDMVEMSFAWIPKEYFLNDPYTGNSYKEKLDYVKKYFSNSEISFENLKSISDKEFENLTFELFSLTGLSNSENHLFNDAEYDATWVTHFNHGNPNLKIADRNSVFYAKGRRAYYNIFANTSCLTASLRRHDLIRDWIAELSHADQFTKKPYINMANLVLSGLQTLAHWPFEKSMSDAYSRTYKSEGSLEHEAHEKIEKNIRAEFYKRQNEK